MMAIQLSLPPIEPVPEVASEHPMLITLWITLAITMPVAAILWWYTKSKLLSRQHQLYSGLQQAADKGKDMRAVNFMGGYKFGTSPQQGVPAWRTKFGSLRVYLFYQFWLF
jgi:hypothetical protein